MAVRRKMAQSSTQMNTALVFLAVASLACLNAQKCGKPEDDRLMTAFQTTDEKDRFPVTVAPWIVAVYVSEIRFGAPQVRLCSGYVVNGRKDGILVADDCVHSEKNVKMAVEFPNHVNNTNLRINVKQVVKLGNVKQDVIGNILVLKLDQPIPTEIAKQSICVPEIGTKFLPGECLLSRWVIEKGKPEAVYGKDANDISEMYCVKFDKRYSPKTGICLKSTKEEMKNSLNSGEAVVCHHENIWYLYGIGLEQRYSTHKLFAKVDRVRTEYEKAARPRFRG